MLPKRSRLSAREVEKVLTQGRFLRSGVLDMKYIKAEGALRASAIVPKATFKLAVKRNNARRTLYRALTGFSTVYGAWVRLFVRHMPKERIQDVLAVELAVLLKNFPQNK